MAHPTGRSTSVSVRRSDLLALAVLAWAGAATAAMAGDAPRRVVSVNLCTDQLALMLAAPGQLVSVSRLSHDADSSVMAQTARTLPANGSGAEEVFLLAPDLVLAGTFTAPATVTLLRSLGLDVVQFTPAQSLADIPDRIAQMGALLGREDAAADLIARFHGDLAALAAAPGAARPRAALYYVNAYTSGDKTLAGDILRAAGFANVASEAGLTAGGTLPLERLVMLAPDVIIQGRDYPGDARAEATLDHPALHALAGTRIAGRITDRDWICGTPHVLRAIRSLRDLRLSLKAVQ